MITKFFEGQRRKMVLENIGPKLNAQNEKRIMLSFSMPLTGQAMTGMPPEIHDAFTALSKLESGLVDGKIDKVFKAQTLEMFQTETAKRRSLLITGADLASLEIQRPVKASGPDKDVTLYFKTTIPYHQDIWIWGADNLGMTFWMAFEAGQYEMEMTPAQAGAAEGEEEVQRNRRRSGKAAAAGDDDSGS